MAELALVVGTGLKAKSALDVGKSQKRAADEEALQWIRKAGVRRAASQRDAISERRLAEFSVSKAIAVAAASGAGVANITIDTLIGDLDAEGEYRALSRLFVGKEEALGMEVQARNLRRGGKAALKAGKLRAAGTIFAGASDWASKYA